METFNDEQFNRIYAYWFCQSTGAHMHTLDARSPLVACGIRKCSILLWNSFEFYGRETTCTQTHRTKGHISVDNICSWSRSLARSFPHQNAWHRNRIQICHGIALHLSRLVYRHNFRCAHRSIASSVRSGCRLFLGAWVCVCVFFFRIRTRLAFGVANVSHIMLIAARPFARVCFVSWSINFEQSGNTEYEKIV